MSFIPNAAKVWFKLSSVQIAGAFAIVAIAWLLLLPVRALLPFGTWIALFAIGFVCVIVARLWSQPALSTLGQEAIDVTQDVYAAGKVEVTSLTKKPTSVPMSGYNSNDPPHV